MNDVTAGIFYAVAELFPGNGLERPHESEWEYASAIVGREIERNYKPGEAHIFAPQWRNRAYLRSQVKRFLIKNSETLADAYEYLRAGDIRFMKASA